MNATLFALLGAFLAGIGARDQMLLAALTRATGRRPMLVGLALLSSVLATAFAAWSAGEIAATLDRSARLILAAVALGAAGAESLLLAPRKLPREPTRSLGAALLVMAYHQVTDAARFLVLAIAVATQDPYAAGIGGAAGAAIALALGVGEAHTLLEAARGLRIMRRLAGGLLLIASVALFIWIRFFAGAE